MRDIVQDIDVDLRVSDLRLRAPTHDEYNCCPLLRLPVASTNTHLCLSLSFNILQGLPSAGSFYKIADNFLHKMFSLSSLLSFLVISNLSSFVSADWKYKSRPDLAPPTLNITVSATSGISSGYIFVAPYSGVSWDSPVAHGPLQSGPYIFTSTGELVWSGFGYVTGFVANFQAARWKGEDVLFAFEASRNTRHGHGHGHAKILNKNYETIKEIRGAQSVLLDIHEFHILDETTTLVESYKPIPFNLQPYGTGPKAQWIVNAIFQGYPPHRQIIYRI